jgi:hypothetical protein
MTGRVPLTTLSHQVTLESPAAIGPSTKISRSFAALNPEVHLSSTLIICEEQQASILAISANCCGNSFAASVLALGVSPWT